jgi:hypothetical protein
MSEHQQDCSTAYSVTRWRNRWRAERDLIELLLDLFRVRVSFFGQPDEQRTFFGVL